MTCLMQGCEVGHSGVTTWAGTHMLRTLGRFREQLEALPEQSALDAQVCVSLGDALVLMSQFMSRLR